MEVQDILQGMDLEKHIYKPIPVFQKGEMFFYVNPIMGNEFTFKIVKENQEYYDIDIFLQGGEIKRDKLQKDWDLVEMVNSEIITRYNEQQG